MLFHFYVYGGKKKKYEESFPMKVINIIFFCLSQQIFWKRQFCFIFNTIITTCPCHMNDSLFVTWNIPNTSVNKHINQF